MRVLVTGGAGFIGSHLASRLIDRGDDVHVLDDMSTGSVKNISDLIAHPRFSFQHGSASDAAIIAECMKGCNLVIHLAAAVGVRLIIEHPVRTIETNVGATAVVLAAAALTRTMVFLASSSEVYGKSTRVPFVEDNDLQLGPTSHSRWAYACTKALDEWLGLAYCRERHVPVIIGRFFNTVGPRQTGRYGMVLPTFAEQALAGSALTVFGNGNQTRCFSHVSDVVEAVLRLVSAPEAVGGVFNIGSDEEVSIQRLAELVRCEAGSNSAIANIPYDEAYAEGFEDMQRRVPDLTRLSRVIGFRPRTSLSVIIRDVVNDKRVAVTRSHSLSTFSP